jgi:fluoride exporter
MRARVRADHSMEASLYLAVGLGSALGGTARWLLSEGMFAWLGGGFPWGTLAVNVAGSFLIGAFAALTGPDGRWLVGPRRRHFFMTGVCGGFTTFSIFSLETIQLLQAGHPGSAAYLTVSLAAWLAAAWAGHALASRMNRLRRD